MKSYIDIWEELTKLDEDVENPLIKEFPENEIKKLLSNIKTDNARYNFNQFKKLFDSNMRWVGEFSDGELKSLAAIKPEKFNSNYINEIQSFEKGHGKTLLINILNNYNNVWLLVDPSASDNLKNYYKQFGLHEFNLGNSIWGTPVTFFLQENSDDLKNYICNKYSKV